MRSGYIYFVVKTKKSNKNFFFVFLTFNILPYLELQQIYTGYISIDTLTGVNCEA